MTILERSNISNILNDKSVLGRFNYLYDRWQDEKDHEDFKDYVEAMMKMMPSGATLVKGTKRPFGVTFKYGEATVQIAIKFENKGKYCKLVAKIIG
jgi:hypothetical protein